MGAGTNIVIAPDNIIANRKSEKLIITIYDILECYYPYDWSDSKIEISRTEAELVDKLIAGASTYFDGTIELIEREYRTDAGPIDLFVKTSTNTYLVEAKRARITLNACYQIRRYMDAYGLDAIPCVAGPGISDNAKKHCDSNSILYISVDFD
jgi:RecB family endonuclease NucS